MDKFNAFDLIDNHGYIDTADCAKLVRRALKANFPGVKFSVRSSVYSMGSSINVGWTDGPTASAVDAVVRCYSGSGFDGMIDLKYNKARWLLSDGTVAGTVSGGTTGSVPAVNDPQPLGGRLVDFMADYIITNRHLSDAAKATVQADLEAKYGQSFEPNTWDTGFQCYGDQVIWRAARAMSF
jgi:hypothetical protein